MEEVKDAVELKNKGNNSLKNNNFEEAILYYTQAIKLDPLNHTLYSNRSLAFLKIQQNYLALQDADETVRLQPQWAKGYFRRGEVEASSGLYDEAILSYGRALHFQPQDETIINSIKRITQLKKDRIKGNENTIWISTCIGLTIGIAIVILDYIKTEKRTLTNPLVMVLFSLGVSAAGFGVGKVIILLKHWDIGKSIQPPISPTEKEETVDENQKKSHTKYSKAQARQRYKQGKL